MGKNVAKEKRETPIDLFKPHRLAKIKPIDMFTYKDAISSKAWLVRGEDAPLQGSGAGSGG